MKDIVKHLSKNERKKRKKQKYGCEQFKHLPENEKQKLVEYRKENYKMRKNALLQLQETIVLKSNDLEKSSEKANLLQIADLNKNWKTIKNFASTYKSK